MYGRLPKLLINMRFLVGNRYLYSYKNRIVMICLKLIDVEIKVIISSKPSCYVKAIAVGKWAPAISKCEMGANYSFKITYYCCKWKFRTKNQLNVLPCGYPNETNFYNLQPVVVTITLRFKIQLAVNFQTYQTCLLKHVLL